MIPRKRKRARMNVRPSTVVRSPGHLKWVRGHYCAVADCHGTQIEAHHIYQPGDAKGRKPGDNWTVPLCARHHEEVGRILGKETFAERYKVDLLTIAAELWKRSPHRIKHERRMKELQNA